MKTVEELPRGRWFADLKAEALACWVRAASGKRLESVMHNRLRSVLLWAIFRTIRQRAQPNTRVNAVVSSGSPAGETVASTAITSRSATAGARHQDTTDASRRLRSSLNRSHSSAWLAVPPALSDSSLRASSSCTVTSCSRSPYPRRSGFPSAARKRRRADGELRGRQRARPVPPMRCDAPRQYVLATAREVWLCRRVKLEPARAMNTSDCAVRERCRCPHGRPATSSQALLREDDERQSWLTGQGRLRWQQKHLTCLRRAWEPDSTACCCRSLKLPGRSRAVVAGCDGEWS